MSNNLKALRKDRGWTQEQVAERLATTRDYYVKLENSTRPLGQKWIDKAAELYGVDPADIIARKKTTVPVVGQVQAGAEAKLFSVGQSGGEFDYVEAPDGSTASTVAVEIEGDSLGRAFDRWLVFYDDVRNPPTPDMFKKLCVVAMADGRVLIKILEKGGLPNTFTLYPNTDGGVIYDAVVEWAAKVKTMVPR